MGNPNPQFLNTPPLTPAVQFTSADTTTGKVIMTATASGGAVTNLNATSSDSVTITAILSLNDGSTSNIIGEVIVAAGAGTDGATPAANLLDADQIRLLQADGSILLGNGASLEVACKATMNTGTLSVTASGGNYAV